MSVLDQLKNVQVVKPIWSGPESDAKNGGVTQSLLGRYLACPARFKALVIDGLRPRNRFNKSIEYGHMFHLCDEWANKGPTEYNVLEMDKGKGGITKKWERELANYTNQLLIKYPYDQEEIVKWSTICQLQFPVYLDYWRNHHESSRSLLQEQVFHVPYKLPSGRTVYLRGKWDGVSLDEDGLWIDESKTKGEIDRVKIERRLAFDLQTMFYLVALRSWDDIHNKLTDAPLKGVKYNCIRRPLSGGKGTIKQTKNESLDEYYDRLKQYIVDEPETYFLRWESEVNASDVEQFEKNTLIPCLERLCYWWNIQTNQLGLIQYADVKHLLSSAHYTCPFGVNHVSDEWGSDYDTYVLSGGTDLTGLEKCTEIFPELV